MELVSNKATGAVLFQRCEKPVTNHAPPKHQREPRCVSKQKLLGVLKRFK
ncbi:hypothetical protein RB2150_11546 [Rhodobacteraceae bacterium HTCC2150]|nr:hypothetical protein RB2150_11546 [Rhodobacteraceae bacterium HTCC2150]